MKLTCPHCPATCAEANNMKRFAKRHGGHCIKKKRREFVKVLAADVKSVTYDHAIIKDDDE